MSSAAATISGAKPTIFFVLEGRRGLVRCEPPLFRRPAEATGPKPVLRAPFLLLALRVVARVVEQDVLDRLRVRHDPCFGATQLAPHERLLIGKVGERGDEVSARVDEEGPVAPQPRRGARLFVRWNGRRGPLGSRGTAASVHIELLMDARHSPALAMLHCDIGVASP